MNKKIILITVTLFFCFKSIFADSIDKKTAANVAKTWIHSVLLSNGKKGQKEIDFIKEISFNEQVLYYIINFNNGGFVVVSADDATKPILAYSDTSSFDANLENPTTKSLFNTYKSVVYKNIEAKKISKTKSPHSGWNRLLNLKPDSQQKSIRVTPFMDDILFSQSEGFEKFCPSDEDGQTVVGCVATAVSQVMRYWEFPSTGEGQMSYNHPKYGNLSVNFENQRYDWDAMSKTVADDENAKLSYHTGVAARMNYGTPDNGGSTTYTANALKALKRNFKYNRGARMISKAGHSDVAWVTIIKGQLNEKKPVLYTGSSDNLQDPDAEGAGHLLALDGYDTTDQGDFFHINWGWAGTSNGYFSLTELITHDGQYNWIDHNSIIVDLYPKNMTPLFTSEPTRFTRINSDYEYEITVKDENRNDVLEVSLISGPSWLTLKLENGSYILGGSPSENEAGSQNIVLNVTDGSNISKQEFNLVVLRNDEVENTSVIDFETGDFSQANFFDDQQFPFSVENNGNYYSRSASIHDNQESILSLTQNFATNTNLTFDYKVSSESGYDFFIFKIDGVVINKWSGEKDWTRISYDIDPGLHTFTWSYKKDNVATDGRDLAMLDNIIFKSIAIDQQAPSVPSNLVASDITETSLKLSWNAATDNAKVKGYEIYQDNIKVATVSGLGYTVIGLGINRRYTFAVKAIDYANNVSEQSNSIQVTTQGDTSGYCESKGNNVEYEWIDFVSLGNMTNATGSDNGYADFTGKVANVLAGYSSNLVISAGYLNYAYEEYFSVWIDYNQNGNFEANEMIVNQSVSDDANNTYRIQIPSNALQGLTRMRVSMKYGATPTACEVFTDGEVEDYTVNIIRFSGRQNKVENSKVIAADMDLKLFPNPSSRVLNIKTTQTLSKGYYQIIDATGKVVDQNSFSPSINIEKLQTGMYFINVYDKKNKYTTSFIKSRK